VKQSEEKAHPNHEEFIRIVYGGRSGLHGFLRRRK